MTWDNDKDIPIIRFKVYTPYSIAKTVVDRKDGYYADDEIVYAITVSNPAPDPIKNVVVWDTISYAEENGEGIAPYGDITYPDDKNIEIQSFGKRTKFTILTVPGKKNGEAGTVTIQYRYKVTADDVGKKIKNAATLDTPDNDEKVTTENDTKGWEIVKSVTGMSGEDGKKAKVGDTLEYTISVKNTGSTTLNNAALKDLMTKTYGGTTAFTGQQYGQDIEQHWSIEAIGPGAIWTVTYRYKVQEPDEGNDIHNVAVATIDGKERSDKKDVPVEKRALDVIKTVISSPSDATSDSYKLGEDVDFKVVVKNIGNVTLNNIHVDDQLEGVVLLEGAETIPSLVPGEESTLVYRYTVQEADLETAIHNIVTARADDGTTDQDDVKVPVEDKKPGSKLTKSITSTGSAEDGKYKVGEIVEYQILVENTGNTTLKNVFVKDEMTGEAGEISDIEGATWDPQIQQFLIDEIPVGETAAITYNYLVVEADVGTTIRNTAVIGDGRPSTPDPVEVEKKDLAIKKEITNTPQSADGKYVVGETIAYKISVTNIGNVTLYDLLVTDQTSGGGTVVIEKVGWFGTNLFANHQVNGNVVTIKALQPGETAEIDCTYIAVPADNGKTVINTAIATYEGQEERDEVPADVKETEPERTPGGGGGSNTSSRRDRDRSTPVADEDVPLVSIDPENVPLADLPADPGTDIMELLDEDVPLAGLAKTGDNSVSIGFLVGMMVVSLLGAFGAAKKRKEDREA